MITLPLPFQKNDRSSDLDIKYPHRSAIVIMDNALTRIYLEAISTNKEIITSIPHRFSIMSTNELVQEIKAILYILKLQKLLVDANLYSINWNK